MYKFESIPAFRKLLDQDGGSFVEADALRVCNFFEQHLTLSSGPKAGQPFRLSDTQKYDLIYPLYGLKRADGTRAVRRCLITSGKKGFGKTAITSGLALYHLLADNVPSPLVVLGACTREQAGELFKECKYSVDHNDDLTNALHMIDSTKTVKYPKENGTLKAVSWEAPGKGGWNCSFVALDEVALQADDRLWVMFKSSMRARKEPLSILLSNAGYDKSHFYYDLYRQARGVLEGRDLDWTFLPVIYEVDEKVEDWKNKEHLRTANPHLGEVITLDSFDEDYADAMKSKAGEMHYRRFSLNQWTQRKNGWIDLDKWDLCKGAFPDLSQAAYCAGYDGSATNDLTSVVAVYPVGDKFYVKAYNFVTESAMKNREKVNLRDYQEWQFAGDLIIVDGNCIDYEMVRNKIKLIPGTCKALVFDKAYSTETSQIMLKEGYECYNFPQAHSYFSEPVRKLETLIAERRIVHDGDLCLRSAISNCELDVRDKLSKPCKPSQTVKIDPVVGLLMGLSQAMLHQGKTMTRKSVYDQRGVFSF